MSEEVAGTAVAANRSRRRSLFGVVEAANTSKTIRVVVTREFKHPKYGKRVRRSKTYVVHDGKGEARLGDTVGIMETRKLSKTKNWRLVEVLKRVE